MNNQIDSAPTNSLKISLIDVLFIIFYKFHIVAGIFLLIVIIAVGHVFVVKPKYSVASSILIKPQIDSRARLDPFNRFTVFRVKTEDINTEVKLMNSKELMLRVAKALKLISSDEKSDELVNEAVNQVRGGLEIEPVTLSSVIQLSKKGSDPVKITEVLTIYLKTYIDWHIEIFKVGNSTSFYREQSAMYKEKLEQAEYDLEGLRTKWGIIDMNDQNEYNVKLLQILRDQLDKIRGEISISHTKISAVNEEKHQTGKITSMIAEFRNNDLLIQLIKRYAPLVAEKERIADLYPESSIEYQNIDRQIKRFTMEIEQEKKNLLNGLRIDLDALKKRKKELVAYIATIDHKSKTLSNQVIKIKQLNRKITRREKTYRLYQNKLQEALISDKRSENKVSNVSVLNWPKKPTAPFYPNKKKRVVIALLIGLIVSVGSAFATYYLDQTIKKPDDLTASVGISVLSSLGTIQPAKEHK